ncbi:hypothetical protein NDU88_005697 [Pleurodeles waltl]|uniref:Uncharacterized protein n=1 Tax=Pleurodeles waltl TaxID=8319 RepID=A0AAV7PKB1_PLEWA|nr:hypothetical protein NDU88_005697 [Pleurodeles waltl]
MRAPEEARGAQHPGETAGGGGRMSAEEAPHGAGDFGQERGHSPCSASPDSDSPDGHLLLEEERFRVDRKMLEAMLQSKLMSDVRASWGVVAVYKAPRLLRLSARP